MKILSLFTILLFIASLSVCATTYYVDNSNGDDTYPGTSTSLPWKTINKVNNFPFRANDFILFKRGSVWYETLKPKTSGTISAYITFGSYGTGNAPLLDMKNSYPYGVYISNLKYLVFQDFKIQNCKIAESAGAFLVAYSSYITIKNNETYITGRAGVFVQNSSYITVLKNYMYTVNYSLNFQTDGIYSQRNSYNIYDGNKIIISNPATNQHNDGIQMYTDNSIIIRNNYIEQNNKKGPNAQGIYSTNGSGIYQIYNNICYGMYTTSGLIKFENGGRTSNTAKIYSNTIYGGQGYLVVVDDANAVIKNNIFYTAGAINVIRLEKKPVSGSNIDYNLYRRNSTDQTVVYCPQNYSRNSLKLSEWKALGYDKNSFEGTPVFVNVFLRDFRLVKGSVGIDRGATLNSPYNYDALGTVRPSGGYDQGAIELNNSNSVISYIGEDENNSGSFNDFQKVEDINSNPETINYSNARETEEENSVPAIAPAGIEISQNYPNPFNPTTMIKFSLPQTSVVLLKVYDILGKEIAILVNEQLPAGNHEVKFNAANLSSGIYIYRIQARDFIVTKKMILTK